MENMMNSTRETQDGSELLRVVRDSLYPGAKLESVSLVLAYCRARGLDPMLKPVHIMPMSVKGADGEWRTHDVPLPGIALYRIQAARSGQYGGKSEPEFGPDTTRELGSKSVTFPAWCRITVRRGTAEFTAKEFWVENYATAGRNDPAPNAMWSRRPFGQLAKVAEAQALRMAFPELTGGEVTGEEMEGKAEPPMPPARGPLVSGEPTPVTAEPWAGMAWPVCDRNGRCVDFGDADSWAAELQRRVEHIQGLQSLDEDGKRTALGKVLEANLGALLDLRRRGYGGEVDGMHRLFRKAMGITEAEVAAAAADDAPEDVQTIT